MQIKPNNAYWDNWIKVKFIPDITTLESVITGKLLPTFDTIETEAEKVSEQTWNRLSAGGDPDTDIATLAETAEDAGIRHYEALCCAKQSLLNLFAVALRHLFEQQQLYILRKALLPREDQDDPSKIDMGRFKNLIKDAGFSAEKDTESKETLEELRHVSNVVKHAECSSNSTHWLREHHPEMFRDPCIRKFDLFLKNTPPNRWIYSPMSGEDIYVTQSDLERYFSATRSYWHSFQKELGDEADMP